MRPSNSSACLLCGPCLPDWPERVSHSDNELVHLKIQCVSKLLPSLGSLSSAW